MVCSFPVIMLKRGHEKRALQNLPYKSLPFKMTTEHWSGVLTALESSQRASNFYFPASRRDLPYEYADSEGVWRKKSFRRNLKLKWPQSILCQWRMGSKSFSKCVLEMHHFFRKSRRHLHHWDQTHAVSHVSGPVLMLLSIGMTCSNLYRTLPGVRQGEIVHWCPEKCCQTLPQDSF